MYLFLAKSLAHFPISIYTILVLDLKRGEDSRRGGYISISRVFLSRLSFS